MTDFYRNKEQIINWLDIYNITNYTVKPHKKYGFVVNIDGDLVISNKKLKNVPVKFNHVTGFFSCSDNELTSLEFAPSTVGGNYSCSKNNLTSLKFLPKYLNGNFYCYDNKLISLKHSSSIVKGDFYCASNELTSLKHSPSIVTGSFSCAYNDITSLAFAPKFIGEDFVCNSNPIESLLNFDTVYEKFFRHDGREGMIKSLEDLYVNNELIISMKNLKTAILNNNLQLEIVEKSDENCIKNKTKL